MCSFQQWTQSPNQPGIFRILTIILVLSILVVLVVLGNALVIAAVILRRRLRSATDLLILSLAVADLLVGLVILPFSIANEVLSSYWIFGDWWCKTWLTMDIWMCTASIYNLVAISIDRYIAIIKPLNYPMLITKFRARCIVAVVWVCSFIICSPSFLLASTKNKTLQTIINKNDCKCTPSNSGVAYIVFSASSSFYIPMIIVIFVYVRIYIAACAATKNVYSGMMQVTATANKKPKNLLMQNPSALSRTILRVHRGSTIKNTYNTQLDDAHLQFLRNCSLKESLDYPNKINSYITDKPLSIIFVNEENDQNFALQNKKIMNNKENSNLLLNTNLTDSDSNCKIIDISKKETLEENNFCSNSDNCKSNTQDNQLTNNVVKNVYNKNLPQFQKYTNRVTGVSENSLTSNETSKENSSKNSKNKTMFLNPNIVKKKRKSYGASMLNRFSRRQPKKKARCAYEKRLSLEIKAAKTVAIVTGCFIFCWLGFSILYGLSFVIHSNEIVWSIVFWLGYLNSALNPVIYTVFNQEFRTCFKRLLTCNHMIFEKRYKSPLYNSCNLQN